MQVYRRNRGLLRFVPYPARIFAGIAATAAVGVLLTPPLLILATPPLVACWLFWRRSLHRMTTQLHNRRWNELASYHLRYHPMTASSSANTTKPEAEARSRVQRAIQSNEQGIASALGVAPGVDITFGELEEVTQDFKGSSTGFAEQLLVRTYGLETDGSRVATVRLVAKNDKMRVEIATRTQLFVLGDDNGGGPVIDVK